MDLIQVRVSTKPKPIAPFIVQTLGRLKTPGYVCRRSSTFTPAVSPNVSFTRALVLSHGSPHDAPLQRLICYIWFYTSHPGPLVFHCHPHSTFRGCRDNEQNES
jgi:hypothetical protein